MVRVGIVVFPGTWSDKDTKFAFEQCGVASTDINFIWHKNVDSLTDKYEIVVLPGGFSYGDYLRAGAIAKHSPIMKPLFDFAQTGGTVIGICNGFQILCEIGLLPGALIKNMSLQYVCKWVHITCQNPNPRFIMDKTIMSIPISHAQGNYFADEATLKSLESNKQIVFKYCDRYGTIEEDSNKDYFINDSNLESLDTSTTINPNGSVKNIAGIQNLEGNILGMMPHPERAAHPVLGGEDGKLIFEAIINYLK